jgi:hypothetical protein
MPALAKAIEAAVAARGLVDRGVIDDAHHYAVEGAVTRPQVLGRRWGPVRSMWSSVTRARLSAIASE